MQYEIQNFSNEPCRYCGDNCPNDHEYMCDGYSGDIDNLYEEKYNAIRNAKLHQDD